LSIDSDRLVFKVRCSKGTYIRVLGESIAEALGTVGHLSALHRISCAGFLESDMETLEALALSHRIFPVESALPYPKYSIDAHQVLRLMQGKSISLLSEMFSGKIQLTLNHQLVAVADVENGVIVDRKMI
jgi:tRNA pseudouridine55 synthase